MVDEIDREMNREELCDVIDSLRGQLRIYRSILHRAPSMPSPLELQRLGRSAKFPSDHERGKQVQREIGHERVPFKSECEGGAGLWDRLTNGAWRDVDAGQANHHKT